MHTVTETSKRYLVCKNHVHVDAFLLQIKRKMEQNKLYFCLFGAFTFKKLDANRKHICFVWRGYRNRTQNAKNDL